MKQLLKSLDDLLQKKMLSYPQILRYKNRIYGKEAQAFLLKTATSL
jgi:hypothetical protein